MKYFKYTIIIVSSVISTILLIPLLIFAILHYWILTPQFLTTTAKEAINEYTSLDFTCRSIELDYINSWPSISLEINEGSVSLPHSQDTTTTDGSVYFRKLYGNIQLRELLTQKKLQIENVSLENPEVNLNLRKQMPLIIKTIKKNKTENKLAFNIKQIDITNADLYIKKKNNNFILKDATLSIRGNLMSENPSFTINTKCNELSGQTISKLLGKGVSFSLEGECKGTSKFNNIALNNTSFYINQFPFELNGTFSDLYKKEKAKADLTFCLLTSNLKEIIDFIPSHILPQKTHYLVTGETSLRGSIKGSLKGGSLPNIKLNCFVDNGSFYKKDINKGIDTINLHMDVCYMNEHPDSCFISLKNTKLKGLGSNIELQGHIANLHHSPFITADFKGFIDFDRIGKEFITTETTKLHGNLESNLSVAFNLKDLKERNLNRIWLDGIFNTSKLEIQIPQIKLNIFASATEASVGYKKNQSDFIQTEDVLSTIVNLDTLKVEYDNSISLNLSKLKLRSNTALNSGDNQSAPITAHVSCQKLQTQINANRWLAAEGIKMSAGTKSIKTTPKTEAACIIKTDRFQYLDTKEQNAISLNNSEFIAELHPGENTKWDIKGLINFQDSKLYTSKYPIDIMAKQGRIGFKNNQLSLNHLQLNVGESDCILSGIITNNIKPKQNEAQIEGTLHLLADNINYNELKETLLYHEAAQREFKISHISDFHDNKLSNIIKNSKKSTIIEEAIIIPKGIELDLKLNLNNMSYEEITLHQVNGDIIIKNGKAYSNLSTRSNLGKINLQALYDSSNKESINAKIDLKLKDILVAQIHNVIPSAKTLFPMISAMDGLINCHFTIDSNLDKQMLPILPTAKAAFSFEGNNLTLLDNKIFQNIASKLMFKNKKRNIIDHLSGNIILENQKIEVIPFPMEWDRYKAIIGGTHTLDFSYNYHVTMLESPIPLDFGVNLSGKTNNFHYKLEKCKYKNLFKDDGIEHNKKTRSRLVQFRAEITKDINIQ